MAASTLPSRQQGAEREEGMPGRFLLQGARNRCFVCVCVCACVCVFFFFFFWGGGVGFRVAESLGF